VTLRDSVMAMTADWALAICTLRIESTSGPQTLNELRGVRHCELCIGDATIPDGARTHLRDARSQPDGHGFKSQAARAMCGDQARTS
jgi:hypothetical protein